LTLSFPVPPTKGEGDEKNGNSVGVDGIGRAALVRSGAGLERRKLRGGAIRCVGTDRPDLMRGSDDLDAIYGRAGDDILKGRGEGDALLGHKGTTSSWAG